MRCSGIQVERKKKVQRKWHFSRWLSAIATTALAVVVFLPDAISWKVNSVLQKSLDGGVVDFTLSRAGLYRSDLSISIRGGEDGSASARLDSCVLEYRPLRLLTGRIDSVRLGGLSLRAVHTNGTVKLPILDVVSTKTADADKAPFTMETLRNLPVKFTRISIDGNIVLDYDGEITAIPFYASADANEGRRWDKIDANAAFLLGANRISVKATCDTTTQTASAELKGAISTYSLPFQFRRALPKQIIGATADVNATANTSFDGARLAAFNVTATCNASAYVPSGLVSLRPTFSASGDSTRVSASLTGLNTDFTGFPATLDIANVALDIPARTLSGTAAVGITGNAPINIGFGYASNRIHAATSGAHEARSGAIVFNGAAAKYAGLHLALDGHVDPASAAFEMLATAGASGISAQDAEGNVVATANQGFAAHLSIAAANGDIDARAKLEIPAATLPAAETTITNMSIAARAERKAGELKTEGDASAGILFRGVRLADVTAAGNFSHDGAFSLDAKAKALGAVAEFGGRVHTLPHGGLRITNYVAIAKQPLDLAILPEIFPELEGLKVSADIEAAGGYYFANRKNTGNFRIALSNGAAEWPAKEMSASDIRINFELPQLPALTSNSQVFRFSNFKLGRIAVDSGRVGFRMYSPSVWFIDNLSLNWAGGKIRGESMRVAKDNRRTWLTLHADRIKLSKVLYQLGAGIDAGERGTISGTIPIVISPETGISFRDAYLYSSPGEDGHIMLTPSDAVSDTAAASVETSLAIDALKDFTYSWVRVGLNSEGEMLNAKLQLDGKPAHDLYYNVGKDGIFKSKRPFKFQGLKLDLSLNLPLNQTLSIVRPAVEIKKNAERANE